MASAGHLLAQRSLEVEARIKTLVNNDLKQICKAYGQGVSGAKIILHQRCISSELCCCAQGRAGQSGRAGALRIHARR